MGLSKILQNDSFLNFSDDPSQPQVLVVVQSAPKNQLLREEVRRTWGHACVTIHSSWCSLVFILGEKIHALKNGPNSA